MVSGAYIELLLLLLPLLLLPLLLLLCTGLSPMAVEAVCNKISRQLPLLDRSRVAALSPFMAQPSLCSSSLLVDGSSSTTVGSNLVGTDMTEKSDALLVSDEEVVSVVLVLRRLLAKPLDSCEGSIIVVAVIVIACLLWGGVLSCP